MNKLEEKGVARDLAIILQKLEKGEYKKGFISSNKFDIPTRTNSLFAEMEFLMQLGHDWEHLLKVIRPEKYKKIADLCPGFTPKIELGLSFLGFRNKITILDIDKNSLRSLSKFMGLFNPDFKINELKEDLFSLKKPIYDLVLGNHIIDDLVVYYYTRKAGVSLTEFYENEEIASDIWKKILSEEKKNISEVSGEIMSILDRITVAGGAICLTQYKSYAEKLFGLDRAYKFNRKVFEKIQTDLIGRGYKSNNELIFKAFKNYKGHFGKKDCLFLQKNETAKN